MKFYLFNLIFKTSGLRIGGETDKNVLYFLKYDEMYVIPFSSWKGSFKRISEYVAKSMKIGSSDKHKDDRHEGYTDNEIEDILQSIKQKGDKIRGEEIESDKYPNLSSIFSPNNEYSVRDVEDKIREYIASIKCPIDGLYGSNFFASKLTFSDSVFHENGTFLTHVTIDRMKMKAYEEDKGGHLFDEEVLRPQKIELKIILRIPNENELKVWKNTLKFIDTEGLQIGGGKSRGLGMLTLDKESTFDEIENFNKISYSIKDILK